VGLLAQVMADLLEILAAGEGVAAFGAAQPGVDRLDKPFEEGSGHGLVV